MSLTSYRAAPPRVTMQAPCARAPEAEPASACLGMRLYRAAGVPRRPRPRTGCPPQRGPYSRSCTFVNPRWERPLDGEIEDWPGGKVGRAWAGQRPRQALVENAQSARPPPAARAPWRKANLADGGVMAGVGSGSNRVDHRPLNRARPSGVRVGDVVAGEWAADDPISPPDPAHQRVQSRSGCRPPIDG